MERCPRCKFEALEFQVIQYSQEFEGKFFIIENVPAKVCSQCGEIIISETVAEKIQKLVWSGAKPKRIALVPVYEVI